LKFRLKNTRITFLCSTEISGTFINNLCSEIFFFIKSSSCCITVSNTTSYCNHTIMLLVFICICLLEWFIFSKSIEFMYLMNCFKYLLVSSLLLTGQLPTSSSLVFRVPLSFLSILHWYFFPTHVLTGA